MKKLITLFLVATVLSCSSDDQGNQNVVPVTIASDSVLDGKILSFKNEESFIKEYSELVTLSGDKLRKWISSKGVVSLLNASNDSLEMEEDAISESRIIYSDALKSILNTESKIMINGKVLWLNDRTFYVLSEKEINKSSGELISSKEQLVIYGQLLSVSGSAKSLTSRSIVPNENRIKTFASAETTISGSRLRHVVDLYNETIVFNNMIQTSKMFLRSTLQYRSCSSIGGCKWREALNVRHIYSVLNCSVCEPDWDSQWKSLGNIYTYSPVTGVQTFGLADLRVPNYQSEYYRPVNFVVSGEINCGIYGSAGLLGYLPSINISWY